MNKHPFFGDTTGWKLRDWLIAYAVFIPCAALVLWGGLTLFGALKSY